MIPFRCQLASDAVIHMLKFPLLASAKIDGIRAIVRDGVLYSRSNKPIRNVFTQEKYGRYEYCDGELTVGMPNEPFCYRNTSSGVMSAAGEPDVHFWVFDHIEDMDAPFKNRYRRIPKHLRLPQIRVHNLQELETLERSVLKQGYEGLILRDALAPYKHGRSSVNEGIMLKLKRFIDGEFKVIGFKERMHNDNEVVINELGYSSRPGGQAGRVGRGDLGALILEHPVCDHFKCGSGFDDVLRTEIWNHRKRYLGKLAKVKYLNIGDYEKPRHPIFLGWRDRDDL